MRSKFFLKGLSYSLTLVMSIATATTAFGAAPTYKLSDYTGRTDTNKVIIGTSMYASPPSIGSVILAGQRTPGETSYYRAYNDGTAMKPNIVWKDVLNNNTVVPLDTEVTINYMNDNIYEAGDSTEISIKDGYSFMVALNGDNLEVAEKTSASAFKLAITSTDGSKQSYEVLKDSTKFIGDFELGVSYTLEVTSQDKVKTKKYTITVKANSGGDENIEDEDTVKALKEVLGREVKNAEKILKDAQDNGSISTPEQKAAEAAYVDAIEKVADLADVETDAKVSTSSEKKSRIVDVELPTAIKTYGDFAKAVTYLSKAIEDFTSVVKVNPDTYAVTFKANNSVRGDVYAKANGVEIKSGDKIAEGTVVTFTARANTGYEIESWTGAKQSTTDKYEATATVGKTGLDVTANFVEEGTAKPTYTVTFKANNSVRGDVYAKANGIEIKSGDKVVEGTVVTFTARANTGYEIESWTGAKQSTTDKYEATATVGKDGLNVTANFVEEGTAKPTYTVTFKANNSVRGDVYAKANEVEIKSGDKIAEGTVVTFTARANTGYEIESWTGAKQSTTNKYEATATVGSNGLDVTANFVEEGTVKPTYNTINISFKDYNDNIGFKVYDNTAGGATYSVYAKLNEAQVTFDLTGKDFTLDNNGKATLKFDLSSMASTGNVQVDLSKLQFSASASTQAYATGDSPVEVSKSGNTLTVTFDSSKIDATNSNSKETVTVYVTYNDTSRAENSVTKDIVFEVYKYNKTSN